MSKTMYRTIYLKDSHDRVVSYPLIYLKIAEDEIIKTYTDRRAAEWIAKAMGDYFYHKNFKDLLLKWEQAEMIPPKRPHGYMWRPRYVTVLTVLDSNNHPMAGGVSLCSASDTPDRRLGYALAFKNLKEELEARQFTVLHKSEFK